MALSASVVRGGALAAELRPLPSMQPMETPSGRTLSRLSWISQMSVKCSLTKESKLLVKVDSKESIVILSLIASKISDTKLVCREAT